MKPPWFHKKRRQEVQPMSIKGVPPAPMTAGPDDAELAAQALLEMMTGNLPKKEKHPEPEKGTAEYYQRLAVKIRQAHDAATLRTMRFVSFCEQELRKRDLPLEGEGSLKLLETELLKRIDSVERVGGELKRRWQHCLADVTVRIMQAVLPLPDDPDGGSESHTARE